MSFKQKCKQNLRPGKQVTIMVDGLEYEGEVVESDFMNPVDAHVTLKSKDQLIHLPISTKMIIMVDIEEEELEDETEDEEPVLTAAQKKALKKKEKGTKK